MMLGLLGQIPLLIVSDTSLLGQKMGTTTGIGLICCFIFEGLFWIKVVVVTGNRSKLIDKSFL
jgi:uncharacterized membrane protein YciS (DUF1049 family)